MQLWQLRVDAPTLHEEGEGRTGTCTREEEEGAGRGQKPITIQVQTQIETTLPRKHKLGTWKHPLIAWCTQHATIITQGSDCMCTCEAYWLSMERQQIKIQVQTQIETTLPHKHKLGTWRHPLIAWCTQYATIITKGSDCMCMCEAC